MKQYRAFRFRIYPNQIQKTLIRKTFGCNRFVYNHFLHLWQNTYNQAQKGLSYYQCATQLPKLKKQYQWLKEVDSISLQSSLRDLADAFDRFFKKQNAYPHFKSKKHPYKATQQKWSTKTLKLWATGLNCQSWGPFVLLNLVRWKGKSSMPRFEETPQGSISSPLLRKWTFYLSILPTRLLVLIWD